jgi:hypothetical protein
MKHELIKTELYLLVVSDEEVKHGDICLCDIPASDFYDIVPYNGAFATHYYKKIVAHRPLNPDHITLNVDLLPPFEEDIKKMAKDWPKLPIAFECEMVDFEVDMGLGEECIEYGQYPKKITNSEGRTEWVGTYIFN